MPATKVDLPLPLATLIALASTPAPIAPPMNRFSHGKTLNGRPVPSPCVITNFCMWAMTARPSAFIRVVSKSGG